MTQRVLVIEDDPDIAEAITYNLERAGMSVKVARTGAEGLEDVRRGAARTSSSSTSTSRGWTAWRSAG